MLNKLFPIEVEELAALLSDAKVEQVLDLGPVLLQVAEHATYGPILTASNAITEACAWMIL